jgi:hypothetical protein
MNSPKIELNKVSGLGVLRPLTLLNKTDNPRNITADQSAGPVGKTGVLDDKSWTHGVLLHEHAPPDWAGRILFLPVGVDPLVDPRNLFYPCMPFFMRQAHDGFPVPVEVIGDERYLLEDILQGVAYDSPRRPNSLSNFAPHSEQVTWMVASSSLIRLYISSRKRRSLANMFSMIPVFTSLSSPS